MDKYKLFTLKCNIIFLLFHLIFSDNYSYITFELELYKNNSDNFDNGANFIYSYLNSLFYTQIEFGSKEKKYIMQVNLDDYGFKLTNFDCNIQTKDNSDNSGEEFFDPFLSNSSKVEISGINFSYYGVNQVYRITDHIKLISNDSNKFIYPNVLFIYNPRNKTFSMKEKNYSPYTCFKLGLRIEMENSNFNNDDISIIGQFKRDRVIGSYEWFLEYNSENNNAKLIIGTTPYDYNSKKYKEKDYKKFNNIPRPYNSYYYWNLEFTQIYMINKNNKREVFETRIASLEPSSNVIKGPSEYSQIINDTIFKELINKKKCFEETIVTDAIITLFYCNNTDEIKKYIKERFLNIIFLERFIMEEFVLTYDDLFMEKGDKLFFLVVFDLSNSKITWLLGKPFLKKYFFSYNYDKKILGYYGKIKDLEENENLKKGNNNLKVIIIIGLIIIFCALGFLLAKYFYMIKKKKYAKELEEDSQYTGISQINEGEGITN